MVPRRVSIRDVAREAGVSVTTVSHALNGKGRLSPDTRARVREVADRLGYRPNPAAVSLVSGHTGLIAAVASLPEGFTSAFTEFGYYAALIGAASGAAIGRDTALVVAPPARTDFIWERVPLDGVIVIDPLAGDPALPSLRAAQIPYVTVGDDPDGGSGAVVTSEDAAAATAMFDHLAEGGGRVGLLSIPPVNGFAMHTLDAYATWRARHGLPDRSVLMDIDRLIADDDDHLWESIDAVLTAGADAIFAPIELIGVEVLRLLRSAGRSVPGDVRLATTDDAGRALAADPPLTAITYDHTEMGRRAAELLLDVAEGRAEPGSRVSVPAAVTRRASTEIAR